MFAIAKGVANEGVVNVQDNLGAVSESAFTDFDQKVVTGTQVKAAIKQFQGKAVAILVNTQAMTKGVKHANNHQAYVFAIGSSNEPYVNYNAILAANEGGSKPKQLGTTPEKITGGTTNVIEVSDSYCKVQTGFAIETLSGRVIFDSNIGGLDKAGNSEYISSSAKFDAYIIKDASNSNIGILFKQLTQ